MRSKIGCMMRVNELRSVLKDIISSAPKKKIESFICDDDSRLAKESLSEAVLQLKFYNRSCNNVFLNTANVEIDVAESCINSLRSKVLKEVLSA